MLLYTCIVMHNSGIYNWFFFLYNTGMRNEKTPKQIHLFETRKTLIAYGFGV